MKKILLTLLCFYIPLISCKESVTHKGKNPYKYFEPIETKRLIVRTIQKRDIKDIHEIMSHESISEWTQFKKHTHLHETENFIYPSIENAKKGEKTRWAIVLKEEDKVIGLISFYKWSPTHNKASIAFLLNKNYWNFGYMTEAIAELISFSFEQLGMNRIEAKTLEGNIGAQRVMEKVGMQQEGIERQAVYHHGKYCSLIKYAILVNDYFTKKKIR